MSNHRAVGTDYEKKAAQYLETLGYQIVELNFRCRQGEIDLIAKEDGYLVFVEVKYRSSRQSGEPQEAVDLRKQRKISRTAAYYCMKRGISAQQACRIEVAACRQGEWLVIKNAFDDVGW